MTIELPERTGKPRLGGVTSIHDVGVPYETLSAILNDYDSFVDIAKFGIGTAYITPRLEEKIRLYRDHDVEPYFGGTLFEKFYCQGNLDGYLDFLLSNSIDWIEISTGTIELPIEERISIIKELQSRYTILAEVGSKDETAVMSPSCWIREINLLLDAGAKYVITEGRESAQAGLYRPSGEVRTGLVDDIIKNSDVDRIIFEAPTTESQNYFLNLVGPDVSLGNINPHDLLRLEAQRRGLKCETFFI